MTDQLTLKSNQNSELQNELSEKDKQIQRLQEQVSDLIIQMTSLNQSYQALQLDYEKLLSDYKLLNAPVSTFVSVSDLDFTITTHQHIYSYKDPVSGNVTIFYHNGTAFRGKFVIVLSVEGKGSYTYGMTFNVNGYGEFYLKPPAFIYGPETYQIGIAVLYNAEGYIVAHSSEIGLYVTVEAK